jgi:Flp pilus assembly protein TadD
MALGLVFAFQGAALTQVEPLFRRAIAAAPTDGRPPRLLGNIFSLRGRGEEARAMMDAAVRLNPRDALVHYNLATHHAARGNLPEAWQHVESALAITPSFASALLLKASLAVRWKGDLVAMRTALDQLPDADRGDDRSVYFAMWGGLIERQPQRVFAAAALGTNDYLRDNLFTGPKAWLRALAHESVAKENLARVEWRAAEALLRQRLREDPKQNASDHWRLAYTLARLGQTEEAAREIAPFELAAGDQPGVASAHVLAQYYAALGDAAKAAPYLRFALKNGGNGGYGGFTGNVLRLEPEWDKLRGKLEFEALLTEAKNTEGRGQTVESQPPKTAPPALSPSNGVSEAAKLLAQAKALYTKLNYTRDDLAIAEDLARKATELEPDSAAAWGARAGVQATYLYRNWDVSEKRRLDTQNAASRALGLNPDEAEALLALGHLLTLQGARPQAEAALRRALAALPEDNRIARALGIFLGRTGRVEEERVILRDALKRNPQDPLLHYDLAMTFANYGTTAVTPADVTAAIEQLDAGIAAQPLGSLLLLKAALVAGCRGDLPAMRAQLDQLEKLPLAERTEDRAVFIAMWGGLLERNSRRVVAAGTLTAKNYFEDTVVPRRSKDWALALAHRLDGKENLARLDWQKAESVLRQRQREDSNNQTYPVELAATLAWLGRKDEAAREVAPIEAAWREELTPPRARTLALFYGAVGDAAKAAPYLRRAIVSSVFTTAYALRLDPWWDKLRGQPEFEALLKEPEPKI